MTSNFYAVDFKDEKLGILDITDKTVEYYSTDQIKTIVKGGIVINGVILDEKTNPIFTLDGLKVNLAYRKRKKFGKWVVAVLKSGDKFGSTLSSTINEDTVFFYDSSVNWNQQEYPYGQFVSSYHLSIIRNHRGSLSLDTSIPAWTINADTMNAITTWLNKIS